jgi:hypothetical protein
MVLTDGSGWQSGHMNAAGPVICNHMGMTIISLHFLTHALKANKGDKEYGKPLQAPESYTTIKDPHLFIWKPV